MLRYITFFLFIALTANSLSQVIEKDTMTIEIIKKVTKSPWGMKFELGALYHHMPTQKYLKDQIAYSGGITCFYNHIFIRCDVFSIDFKPKYPIVFSDYLFNTDAEFTSINLNTELGYNIDYSDKWGTDLRFGVNFTDFSLVNSDDLGGSYTSEMIAGAIIGLTLERYIKLKDLKFLMINLNFDYYSTNYNSISRDLIRSSLNCSLTVAYKFWYSKTIKTTN